MKIMKYTGWSQINTLFYFQINTFFGNHFLFQINTFFFHGRIQYRYIHYSIKKNTILHQYKHELKRQLRAVDPIPHDLMTIRAKLPIAAAAIPPEKIKKACLSFYRRLSMIIDKEGEVIELALSEK